MKELIIWLIKRCDAQLLAQILVEINQLFEMTIIGYLELNMSVGNINMHTKYAQHVTKKGLSFLFAINAMRTIFSKN